MKEPIPPEIGIHNENHNLRWDDLNIHKFIAMNVALTGCLDLLSYPIDVVKTQVQASGSVASNTHLPKFTGPMQAARHIARTQGVHGFFPGFVSQLIGTIPGQCLHIAAYERFYKLQQNKFSSNHERDEILNDFLSSCYAEVLSAALLVPTEVVTSKIQVQGIGPKRFRGGLDCVRVILREEGIRGLYRGSVVTLVSWIPSSGISFSCYHWSKKWSYRLAQKYNVKSKNMDKYVHSFSGYFAGIVSLALTTPIDVVKTRIQAEDNIGSKRLYSSLWRSFTHIWKTVLNDSSDS
jgi:hypothetical protein